MAKIIIVDDEQEILTPLEEMLTSEGFKESWLTLEDGIFIPTVLVLLAAIESGGDRMEAAPHTGAGRPADRTI